MFFLSWLCGNFKGMKIEVLIFKSNFVKNGCILDLIEKWNEVTYAREMKCTMSQFRFWHKSQSTFERIVGVLLGKHFLYGYFILVARNLTVIDILLFWCCFRFSCTLISETCCWLKYRYLHPPPLPIPLPSYWINEITNTWGS